MINRIRRPSQSAPLTGLGRAVTQFWDKLTTDSKAFRTEPTSQPGFNSVRKSSL
jgi:hypothetical protein